MELLVLPYDAEDGNSLVELLVRELSSDRWESFRAAVAFVRSSGNFPALLTALRQFAERGGLVSLTFGADLFGSETPASDFDAVRELVGMLDAYRSARVHLYHEPYRTFHPKMYVFANQDPGAALIILGSSNWSEGGLLNNVEANVVMHLTFEESGHREFYEKVLGYFTAFWNEVES